MKQKARWRGDELVGATRSDAAIARGPRSAQRRTRVLLNVIHRRRDLYPMVRLANALMETGRFDVQLSGRMDFKYAVTVFRPHIIVVGKADHEMGDHLRSISGAYIVSINSEQGGLSEAETVDEFVTGHAYIRPPAHDRVDAYLLTDERTKEIVSTFLDHDKLHVVGYLRLLECQFAEIANPVLEPFRVGIVCGEDVLNREYLAQHMMSFRDPEGAPYPGGYPGEWSSVEQYAAYSIVEWGILNQVTEILQRSTEVLVRTRYNDHEYLAGQSKYQVDTSSDPSDFLSRVDIVIVGGSTLGIEAMISGVPAISVVDLIRPMFQEDLKFALVDACWKPQSLEELLSMIKLRRKEKLSLAPRPHEYRTFVSDSFYCGGNTDRSIEKSLEILDRVVVSERGASLNIPLLSELQNLNSREIGLLNVSTRFPYRWLYSLILVYLRVNSKRFGGGIFFLPPILSRRNVAK